MTLTPHEQNILDNATCFTAVRGRQVRNRTRLVFPSMAEAVAYAKGYGDGRTMIYAVTAEGRDAHIRNA
jgi:hypothetical protein